MKKVSCHSLKITPTFFAAVLDGSKTFEIRFDDRDYKQGDFVVLHEFANDQYSGKNLAKRIGFITDYEQQLGYVAFSLQETCL